MRLDGVGVWSAQLRFGDPAEAAEAATELDELGYRALWIPDAGGPVFDTVESLAAATERLVVATGVLNLWMQTPEETTARYAEVSAAYPGRILLGVGVSHGPVINRLSPGRYRQPLAATAAFLDALDAAPEPVPTGDRVLAALGPKMLELAAKRTAGTHPYLTSPEHTAIARAAVGPDGLVLPEQTVILCSRRSEARDLGEPWLRRYLELPNYANNLRRLGFTDADLTAVSDRLFDALFAWGSESEIRHRIDEHRAAGADHVCVQVLTSDQLSLPRAEWRTLAAALL